MSRQKQTQAKDRRSTNWDKGRVGSEEGLETIVVQTFAYLNKFELFELCGIHVMPYRSAFDVKKGCAMTEASSLDRSLSLSLTRLSTLHMRSCVRI